MLGTLARREPGLIGYCSIHLLHHEGFGGIVKREVHDFDIGLAEASFLQQDAQVELLQAAAQDRHRPALEIGDGPNVFGGQDAIAAMGFVERKHAHQTLFIRFGKRQYVLGTGCDRVDLAGEQSGEGGGVVLDVDQLDLDAFLGEETLLLSDEKGP